MDILYKKDIAVIYTVLLHAHKKKQLNNIMFYYSADLLYNWLVVYE